MIRTSKDVRTKTGKRFDGNHASYTLEPDYFRLRDFEYVQPFYDLAFLLEVDALARGSEVPKYRTFSLWRAAYSLDSYGTTIDRWLDGLVGDEDLDYVASPRIQQYLRLIRRTGTLPELRSYRSAQFERCLRLRSVRGLGPSKIALTISADRLDEEWFSQVAVDLSLERDRILQLYHGSPGGSWQSAHVVPPLLRFLNTVEECHADVVGWAISGVDDPFQPITQDVTVTSDVRWEAVVSAVSKALKREKQFRRATQQGAQSLTIRHGMGWTFRIVPLDSERARVRSPSELARALDPLAFPAVHRVKSDLHSHTSWSDGSASVNTMAKAMSDRALQYFAVTDHSRSSKLQNGLTPSMWLRQANALTLATPVCPVLHGTEVDILRDGALDLPHSLLAAADIVVASVHSNWTTDIQVNTNRLLRAVESGCVDILAHPTSALIGKPGIPDYVRPPADVDWEAVFKRCSLWDVAVELNCFPSRLDLPLNLLRKAIELGCVISLGSDAHARAHLINLRFGESALNRLKPTLVLNRLSYAELRNWVAKSRARRNRLKKQTSELVQAQFEFDAETGVPQSLLEARIQPPQKVPSGSRIVGLDLTAGDKETGVALLNGYHVQTCSLRSDDQILDYIAKKQPRIVSIDSPLGLPGGGASINAESGIVRVAEHDLASIGIPAYPALIDSMQNLTLRGIRLKRAIEDLPNPPRVIESYPGAAQDILCIPRKQKSLELLREGLRRLGLRGSGLDTPSHDEMDAITAAIVGRYFETGTFEPMGVPAEAQLIVPKIRPLIFDRNPVICLAGKTGAGKSVVARYLGVFYGFTWIRTRDIIRDLLVEDIAKPYENRLLRRSIDPNFTSESDLREFGALVLDVCHQEPLRAKLTETINRLNQPIVIDSIRDIVDIAREDLHERPMLIWFVDCKDSLIRQRLSTKTKLGTKRVPMPSPVDHTADFVRRRADHIIPNSASLEELRWRVDDALFSLMRLRR